MNDIEILINPYENTSRININNRPISPYSEISKYLKEPFYIWCDKVLETLSRELNDEFQLTVVSGKSEELILKGLSEGHEECLSLKRRALPINVPLSERLGILENIMMNQRLGKNPISIESNVFVYHSINEKNIRNIFNDRTRDFTFNENKNKYSLNKYPLSDIRINIIEYSLDGFEKRTEDANFIIVSSLTEAEKVQKEIIKYNKPCFIIVLEKEPVTRKYGHVLVCSCNESNLLDIVVNFLEFRWITPMFVKSVNEVKGKINSEHAELNLHEELMLLSSVDPFVTVNCATQIEVNTTVPLIIKSYPDNIEIPPLNYKLSKENIIAISGDNVVAVSTGDVNVEVFIQGSLEPISKFHVSVIKRNKIQELFLNTENHVMGIRDVLNLTYSIVPENADNQGTLRWSSSDHSIASVDNNGYVVANGVGTCYITLSAENVSRSCLISVKPTISSINLSENQLDLYIGNSAPVMVTVHPVDTINDEISWEISDPNVITFENGVVKAIGIGNASLTFYTTNRTVSNKCHVKVSSTFEKKEYSNRALSGSVILFVLSIILSFVDAINLFVPLLGALSGGIAIKSNKNGRGTATLFIILNLAVFIGIYWLREYYY